MSDIHSDPFAWLEARGFLTELTKRLTGDGQPLRLTRGMIMTVMDPTDLTFTVLLEGCEENVAGIKWLIGAIQPPQIFDNVWILEVGSGYKIILGPTDLSDWDPRGSAAPYNQFITPWGPRGDNIGWPDSFAQYSSWPVNQSPSGLGVTASARYTVALPRGTFGLTARFIGNSNCGIADVYFNNTLVVNNFDTYRAAALVPLFTPQWTIDVYVPGLFTLRVFATGTKNATATAYYILFAGLDVGWQTVPP